MMAYDSGGVTKDFLTDHLGSITAEMDQNQNRTFETRYSAYGRNNWSTGTGCGFGWVGSYGYRETGLFHMSHYVRARHYSYLTGNWSTVDPLWPDESAYGYVGGRASILTDGSGRGDSIGSIRRDCSKLSKQACFACAFNRISRLRFWDHKGELHEYVPPQLACEQANQICGSHVVCGPCGPGPGPTLPGNNVCDVFFWNDWAQNNLHEPSSGAEGCGKTGWDKLAHCFVACVAGSCDLIISAIGCRYSSDPSVEDDPYDRDANYIGWEIGARNNPSPSGCLAACAKAIRGLPGHD